MRPNDLKSYYVLGIKALIFIIPLLSIWIASSMYFPYITGRNFAFRILIELALILYLALAILDKNYRPKKNLVLWAVGIFVLIVGLADILGANPYRSFWSNYERMEGFLTILHLAIYFLIVSNIFRSKKEWITLLNVFLIAGLLVSGYGVLQLLGIKEAIQGGDVRIDGTIGNPTYLAIYLTLIIGLAAVLFFNADVRWKKNFYGGSVIFLLIIMFFTASRGAALAWGIGLPLFSLLYLVLFKKEEQEKLFRRMAIFILAAVVIVPTLFFLVKNVTWVKDHPVLSRFSNLSFGEKTVRSRFMIWGIGLEGFKERPILGWGQENFIQVFSKYFNPGLYDQEPWFDRTHNIIFDWLINAGILGLASYLFLFFALFSSLWKGFKAAVISKKEWLVLTILPIVYFLQNFFVFDNFNTYVIFFTLLAFAASLRSSAKSESAQPNALPSLIALIAGFLIILPITYFIVFKPAAQAAEIISGLMATASPKDPVGETLSAFDSALKLNTFGNSETLEQLAKVTRSLMDQEQIPTQIKMRFLNFAVPHLENYVKKFPNDIRARLFLGDLYQGSSNLIPANFAKSTREFEAALALSPKKQQILTVLANNYLYSDQINEAIELLQKAIDLAPHNLSAHGNKAIVAVLIGRNDVVQSEINAMNKLRLSPERKDDSVYFGSYIGELHRIADAYLRVGQKGNAITIYQEIVKLAPTAEAFKETLRGLIGK